MGLLNKLVDLQGKATKKQEDNMNKVDEVFKEKTGKNDYGTMVVVKTTTTQKFFKTVYTYYNWIMGYGLDADKVPEIVLIPVTPDWDWVGDPIYCKKTDSEMVINKRNGLHLLRNSQLDGGELDIWPVLGMQSLGNAGFIMDVNYFAETGKLVEYLEKYWDQK